jgi:hypothetical protein
MMTRLPSARDVRRWAGELEEALGRGVDEARAWLATPQGRRLRLLAAQALVLTAPVLLRGRFFRTPVGRLIEAAGGAALLIKLAELLRDWEPEPVARYP